MIYEKNNTYYIKTGSIYYVANIVVKPHTIAINKTSEYVTELENATKIDYRTLKNRYIKREESTNEVDSLNYSDEV